MPRRRKTAFWAAAIGVAGCWGCARTRPPSVPVAPPAPPAASDSTMRRAPPTMRELHEQVALQVLTALGDHDFDAVMRQFDDRMRQDVPKEKVSRVWSGAVAAHGELLSWKLLTREDVNAYEELLYELELENGRLEARLTFEEKGTKVAGLYIRPSAGP